MSCTDCASNEIKYVGNGSQVLYTFPFTYYDPTDVYVELYNFTTQRWEKTTLWGFANATTVQFNTAPPAPPSTDPNYPNIRLARCTDIDPLAATFYPGSAIRAQDLNNNFEMLQMAIQEGRCHVPDWLYDFIEKYYWNKGLETLKSGDAWQASDEYIVTALRGDERWLRAAPGPGPGVSLVDGIGTSIEQKGDDVAYDITPSTFWGQTYPTVTSTGAASTVSGDVSAVGTVQFGTGTTYTFPSADGTAGDVLTTGGDGSLQWAAQSGGGGGGDATIVLNVAALNTAAAGLDASNTGDIYLIQDSTNIDSTANPAVSGLPAAPQGGWSNEIQTTVQWTGTAWAFVRYAAKNPDARYVNVAGDTMTGLLTLSGAPTADLNAATKKYVDDNIPTPTTVNNNKITLKAGTGLSGGGDFTLNQSTDKEITFTNSVTAFNGGEVTTSITTPERTITAGAFDMSTGPYWTCGAIAIPNPTDAVSGMAGLIRVTAEPVSWGGNFSTAPTPTVFPSIIPFYVQSATSIRLGQAVGVA